MSPDVKLREVTMLAQSLLRIPSVTGHEAQVADFVRGYLQALGFEAWVNDYYTVIAVLQRGDGPVVLMDSHIDTVEADAAGWRHPPFAGEIEAGRLYGRGASDMKGALAAMLHAATTLATSSFAGVLVITGTSWEERFEGYTLGKALDELATRGIQPDYVIIGEASELNIKRGQRGRTRVFVDIQGKAAHSAHPEKGINAVYQAVPLIQRLRALPPRTDDFLGPGIIELIGLHSSPQPVDSIVPYAARLSYDLRLLPGESPSSVWARFHAEIAALAAQDPDFRANVELAQDTLVTASGRQETIVAFPPAWKLPADHPLVQKAQAALLSIGLRPQITKYDFCTNGSYSAGVARIPTIGFGPGTEASAHVTDESISLEELAQASAGYAAICRELWRR